MRVHLGKAALSPLGFLSAGWVLSAGPVREKGLYMSQPCRILELAETPTVCLRRRAGCGGITLSEPTRTGDSGACSESEGGGGWGWARWRRARFSRPWPCSALDAVRRPRAPSVKDPTDDTSGTVPFPGSRPIFKQPPDPRGILSRSALLSLNPPMGLLFGGWCVVCGWGLAGFGGVGGGLRLTRFSGHFGSYPGRFRFRPGSLRWVVAGDVFEGCVLDLVAVVPGCVFVDESVFV